MIEREWFDLFNIAMSIAKSIHGKDFSFLPAGLPINIHVAAMVKTNVSEDCHSLILSE
jgi:hypothetical protein